LRIRRLLTKYLHPLRPGGVVGRPSDSLRMGNCLPFYQRRPPSRHLRDFSVHQQSNGYLARRHLPRLFRHLSMVLSAILRQPADKSIWCLSLFSAERLVHLTPRQLVGQPRGYHDFTCTAVQPIYRCGSCNTILSIARCECQMPEPDARARCQSQMLLEYSQLRVPVASARCQCQMPVPDAGPRAYCWMLLTESLPGDSFPLTERSTRIRQATTTTSIDSFLFTDNDSTHDLPLQQRRHESRFLSSSDTTFLPLGFLNNKSYKLSRISNKAIVLNSTLNRRKPYS